LIFLIELLYARLILAMDGIVTTLNLITQTAPRCGQKIGLAGKLQLPI